MKNQLLIQFLWAASLVSTSVTLFNHYLTEQTSTVALYIFEDLVGNGVQHEITSKKHSLNLICS